MADVSTVLVDSGALSSPPDPAVPVAGDEITVDVESSTGSGLTVGTPAPPAGSATVETDQGGSPSQGVVSLPMSHGATVETDTITSGGTSDVRDEIVAERARAIGAESHLQDEIDALADDTDTKIDNALDPIKKRQDDSDDAAAEAAAAEAAARQALSTAVTQALAQASSDIQAAHDAADLAAQQAASALTQAKGDLQGAINTAKSDLQTAIAAVQASSDGVAAALASESTVRHDADSAEATARTTAIAGVQSGLNTLAAALTTEQTTRADADSAEVSARTAAVAGVQHGVDTVTAGLANEITVRAAADSAETSARQTQVSQVQNAVDTVAAGLTSEATTRANADSAETSARQSAISSLQGALDTTNAALTAEATTRATNDSAETSQRQAAVASLQGAINDANAAIVSEANTRATNDSAETTARQAQVTSLQGQINTTNAALTSEANTRSTADSAETSARQAAISSLQGAVDTVNAALTNEANTRATADAAETNARQSAVASLQGAISDATAAISNEASTRATADAAETAARQAQVSVWSAKGSPKRIWTQASAPTFADIFPPGVQACPVGNLDNPTPFGQGINIWTNTARAVSTGIDLDNYWRPEGGHAIYACLNGNWSAEGTYECFDVNGFCQPRITPGVTYEWSVYTGAHRCRVFIGIYFYDAGGGYISTSGVSDSNDWEKSGGGSLSGYKRLYVRSVAPAGVAFADLIVRADNQGANNKTGQASPYVFVTRPQFVRVTSEQPAPVDWQPYDAPAWIDTGDNNKTYRWSGINGATWVEQSDLRIAANAAAITSEAATRASADAAETSQRQAAISAVQTDIASNLAAINSEASTRATADTAETNARQAAISTVQGQIADANAAITAEATTRAAADSAETTARQSAVSSLQTDLAAANAAIAAEASTRATADTTETTQRQAAVSALQGAINDAMAAITSEASTRATQDTAETNARTAAVASLQDGLNAANAAIITEQNARVTADSSEASARTTLSSSLSAQINPKRIFASATAPTFDQLFPANVQACPVANLKPADGLNGISYWTNTSRSVAEGLTQNGPWNLTGEASVYANLSGTWAAASTYEIFDISDFGQCQNIVAGQRYEFSAYTGAHRGRAIAVIIWHDASWNYLGEAHSDGAGLPLYTFGGVNAAEKLGGNALSDWKRLGLIAQAPTGATRARFVVRTDNQGFGGNGDPYCFACRPYFGLARNDQTTLTDWQPFQPALWLDSANGNKANLWSGINGATWAAADDARISANATSISQVMSTTDGLKAMWGVQINTDGKVIGRVKLDGSNGTSSFDVLADSFTVSAPGIDNPIFSTGVVNGQTKIVMRADVIEDNSISQNAYVGVVNTAAHAISATISNIALKAGDRVLLMGDYVGGDQIISGGGWSGVATMYVNGGSVDTLALGTALDINSAPRTQPLSMKTPYTVPTDGAYTFVFYINVGASDTVNKRVALTLISLRK